MSENALTIRTNTALSIPTEHEMMVYHTMAEQAVSSKMYRGIGEKAGVMMIMLSARELGIPPMQALNGGINIINGKAEISARMMSALIRKAGHTIKIKESSDSMCSLIGIRGDTHQKEEVSFSIEDAQKAGLVKPAGGWVKWPKDMCFARALSRLARQLFSDVIGIGYVEGEIQACTNQISIPDDIPEVGVEKKETIQQVLGLFPEEDHHLVEEYVKVVMNHFKWSEPVCIQKFLEDKDLIKKFNQWKLIKKSNPVHEESADWGNPVVP